MTIGDRIKARREELGWTQEELAMKMGYKSKSTINKVEMGKVDISQKRIPQYARVLMTTERYLMGWDEAVPTNGQESEYYLDEEAREIVELMHKDPQYRTLFSASRKLSKEDLQIIMSMIERMS